MRFRSSAASIRFFHHDRAIAQALIIKEVCLRAEREKQVIELEFAIRVFDSVHTTDFSRAQIDIPHFGFDEFHATQNARERIDNVARRKIARPLFRAAWA
jgi:hypothetical protein